MPPASCIWARSELAFRPMWRAIRVPDSPAARLVHSSATSASVSGLCRGLYFLRFLICVGIGFFVTGPLIYLVGRHGFQLVRWSFFGPGAIVMKPVPGQSDRAVELLRVHPAFAAAVLQMQAASPPQSTGTN